MHTLLDLRGNIPTLSRITDGKVHDVHILDEFLPEPGTFYVMDRAYVDFERLFVFTLCSSFFVVRTKKNILLQPSTLRLPTPLRVATNAPVAATSPLLSMRAARENCTSRTTTSPSTSG